MREILILEKTQSMKKLFTFPLLFLIIFSLAGCKQSALSTAEHSNSSTKQKWSIIIHGGAGSFYNGQIDDSLKSAYEKSMLEALSIGETVLRNGGTSLNAVEQTINILENDSLFNAGRGAVLTSKGTVELDASIMTGNGLNAGAVAGVTNIKHPISAARKVMEKSPHVFLAGKGAEEFAKTQQLQLVPNNYFITNRRLNSFKRQQLEKEEKMGTVGCVAIDQYGNITAGTSTGGTSFKQWGRIGDSPIIGAGTYANNNSCGVSATGWGEYFIRGTVARNIAALMEYKEMNAQQAADEVMFQQLPAIDSEKATGGVIVIDKNGNVAYAFNTIGMLYAFSNAEGNKKFGLYKD